MQLSNLPAKITTPFANTGTKNTIPVASQIGITPGAASYTDGFPPLTLTPVASGGVPPYGADFNGILNAITAIQQWQSGGGMFEYDSAWSTANGGYPKGAILLKATGSGYWANTVDNNTVNPDTTGTNWVDLGALLNSVSASTTVAGKVRLATLTETQTGTDATIAVTPAGFASAAFGVSQNWTTYTVGSTRVVGTTYYNTTPKAITVMGYGASVSPFTAVVNGVTVGLFSGSTSVDTPITFIVPPGQSYQINSGGGTLVLWVELR